MADRGRYPSMVWLGVRPMMTAGASLAIVACWLLLLVGVLFVPMGFAFWALITSGPIEYSGPRPPPSGESIALLWVARILATASALGVLAISVAVTARGGRLINGWLVLALSLPIIFLLWDVRFV